MTEVAGLGTKYPPNSKNGCDPQCIESYLIDSAKLEEDMAR